MTYRKCIVSNCTMLKTETFHRIPKKAQQRTIWLDRLNLLETSANGRVCSKHFEPTDFTLKGDGSLWLKQNVYPKQVKYEFEDLVNEIEIDDEAEKMSPMRLEGLDTSKAIGKCKIDAKDERRRTTKGHHPSTVNDFSAGHSPAVNKDEREWKETEFYVDNVPCTGRNDTIADLQMNCSVYAVYHNSIYEEHNYTKFACTKQGKSTLRDWIMYRRRELRFDIKFLKSLRRIRK